MPPRKKRKKRVTKKQKKLVDGLTKGLSLTDAGKVAGFSNIQAASRAFKLIKLRFHPALEAAGYSVDKELSEIYGLLKSKMYAKEQVFFQNQGVVTETRIVDPHDLQRRAANDCARLIGATSREQDEPERNTNYDSPAQVSVTLVITDPRDTAAIMELSRSGPANNKQLTVDAAVDQNARRSGSEPSL